MVGGRRGERRCRRWRVGRCRLRARFSGYRSGSIRWRPCRRRRRSGGHARRVRLSAGGSRWWPLRWRLHLVGNRWRGALHLRFGACSGGRRSCCCCSLAGDGRCTARLLRSGRHCAGTRYELLAAQQRASTPGGCCACGGRRLGRFGHLRFRTGRLVGGAVRDGPLADSRAGVSILHLSHRNRRLSTIQRCRRRRLCRKVALRLCDFDRRLLLVARASRSVHAAHLDSRRCRRRLRFPGHLAGHCPLGRRRRLSGYLKRCGALRGQALFLQNSRHRLHMRAVVLRWSHDSPCVVRHRRRHGRQWLHRGHRRHIRHLLQCLVHRFGLRVPLPFEAPLRLLKHPTPTRRIAAQPQTATAGNLHAQLREPRGPVPRPHALLPRTTTPSRRPPVRQPPAAMRHCHKHICGRMSVGPAKTRSVASASLSREA